MNFNQSIYSNNSKLSIGKIPPTDVKAYQLSTTGDSSAMSLTNDQTSLYKNMRTIDRAAIFEEIQQNKMEEMRNQLTNNKGFVRKLNMSNMTS